MRGVIAPAQKLGKERLADIIDLIELSTLAQAKAYSPNHKWSGYFLFWKPCEQGY